MSEENVKKPSPKKKTFLILAVVGIIAVIIGGLYWRYVRTHISTDDAYVQGTIYPISFRVPGTVTRVLVKDNQLVEEGQALAELDPTDYEVAAKQARANLEQAKSRWESARLAVPLESDQTRARVDESRAGVGTFENNLAEAREQLRRLEEETRSQKALLDKAELDRDRFSKLYQQQAISRQQFDETATNYEVAASRYQGSLAAQQALKNTMASLGEQIKKARAQVDLAQTGEKVVSIKKQQLEAAKAELDLAEARLEQARLQLAYTRIMAPARGRITKKSLETGQRVQAGQPVLALVSLEEVWVAANYKETQLTRVKVGQKAKIEVDTFPGKKIRGRVESIMAGTGSAFSLFPPENATGNFVKIVQRIPVKIVLDKNQELPPLRIGMSVVPTILVED
ncbi:MAG: HlyD family secretion protein [Deltaproteobacteria bacterium]|nr:HlyD family secretion protein [Deltaproteobacteria bacterium]